MIGTSWNVTAQERAANLPCDALLPGALRVDRAISIDATPAMVFAWLCQMRVAPYSYDLLDNTGRRSPRTRTPALTELAVGQPFVRIFGRTYVFELASFKENEHLTLRPREGSAMSGGNTVVNTYALRPDGTGTRLHVRALFDGPWVIGQTWTLVNLLMMRKQLLVFKALAEREAREVGLPR
ncbi:SRPBCC family protein [Mycobacterium deserti]|uniref:SRPBCC family protein n=1 Tax=Mycobacterium deserti TaxID=2978347 RepID=A0ABT2MFH5_9MYCO|nr:SRPBCC family protein [Mycobacterium deserti]MCT7661017.1 SRPBCC family protein [Mycobacterium deserti]